MSEILKNISNYYTQKIQQYGTHPQGVDWKDERSQLIRFNQLLKVISKFGTENFTLNDLGCGYGKLYDYILEKKLELKVYNGYDLSDVMIKSAKNRSIDNSQCQFFQINKTANLKEADYTVASGIFNVKMGHTDQEWLDYILETISIMAIKSKHGFAFNILSSYSDEEFRQKKLYYADPSFFFNHCKINFSRNVSLLHDYDLYEFTIIVKKVRK